MCALERSLFFRQLRCVIAMCSDFPQCGPAPNFPTFLISFNRMPAKCATSPYAQALRVLQPKVAGPDRARPFPPRGVMFAAATPEPLGVAAFRNFYPTLRSGLWRKSGRLHLKMAAAILTECRQRPASLSLWRPNSLASCFASLGPFRAVRPGMTSRHGPSPTIGPSASR